MMGINWGRVATLIKKDFIENRKTMLLRLVMLIGSMIILSQIVGITCSGDYEKQILERWQYNWLSHDPAWTPTIAIFIIGLFFVSAFSASFMFENMTSKAKRLTTLTLPATNGEKYLARFVTYVIGFFFVYAFACVVAELSRWLVFTGSYPDSQRVILLTPARFIEFMDIDFTEREIKLLVLFVGGFLFNQSLFGLGGAVWPKNSFIKTFGAIWAISIVYQLFSSIFVLMLDFGDVNPNENVLFAIVYAFLYLGTIFNWVLAYYRFKESEIIQRM